MRQSLQRKRNFRPQYRLRLESGRCLTYYEVGQENINHKRRKGDLVLAIYGDQRHADRWCERYNREFGVIGLTATVWAYKGSKPLYQVTDDASHREQDNG